MHQGIAGLCAAEETHVRGVIVVFVAPAEGDNLLVKPLHRLHGVGVVAVHNNGAGAVRRELTEGLYRIFNAAEVVKVVVIYVQNNGNVVG